MAKLRGIVFSNSLISVFFLLFTGVFSLIGLGVLFDKSWYNYNTLTLIAFIFVFSAFITAFYKLVIKKLLPALCKHFGVVLLVFGLFMLTMQLVFADMLRFDPIYDMEAAYNGAIEWVQTGTFVNYHSSTCYADYFYIFPNNLGLLSVLAALFKLCNLFKITDYFMAAAALNSICSVGCACVTSLVCKRLLGKEKALLVLFLFLIFPPYYFCAAVFYTDFLTLIFPIGAYYLYLCGSDCTEKKRKIVFYALSCLVAGIGIIIKFTVIILIIAVLLECLLRKKFKNAFIYALCAAVVCGSCYAGFNGFIYSKYLDKATAAEQNTPYSHWIMMGLANDGDYESGDFWNTRSYSSQSERKAAISAETKARLKKLGVSGILSLIVQKSVRCFGDGTCNLTDFLDDNPQKTTFLHSWLLSSGSHHYTYRHICAGIYLAIFTLMLFGAAAAFCGKKQEQGLLVPLLCVFGIMLFLLMWEVNSRYIVNFLPFIFIAATAGIDTFYAFIKKIGSKIIYRRK